MRTTWLFFLLACLSHFLRAQALGPPELGLDVNGQSEAVVAKGWPLLIRTVVIPAGSDPVVIGLGTGAWTQALRLTVTDQNGSAQNWPVQLVAPPTPSLALSGIQTGEAVWLVAPADTSGIPAGLYNLSVTLDTTTSAKAGTWSGGAQSNGATVQLGAEPATLSAEDEASKDLALAAYSRLRGDSAGAESALNTLMTRQPDVLEAYSEKADLLAARGAYSDALTLSEQALEKFNTKRPNPAEAPVTLELRVMALGDQLAAQQRAMAGDQVACVLAGNKEAVLAPDSIASAYGTSLATGTAEASASLQTQLAGTTVTITDSAGVQVSAALFFVSPGQVNFLVPGTVAMGAATVAVHAGDGTTEQGKVTIAGVEPGLFTLNSELLIAGGLLRVASDGTQSYENVYSVDAAGSIVAAPVDVTNGQVYLTIYGTGFRSAPGSQVTASLAGVNAPVLYSGAQGSYQGLDQVNIQLPASLAGRGNVALVLTVAGKTANAARITIR